MFRSFVYVFNLRCVYKRATDLQRLIRSTRYICPLVISEFEFHNCFKKRMTTIIFLLESSSFWHSWLHSKQRKSINCATLIVYSSKIMLKCSHCREFHAKAGGSIKILLEGEYSVTYNLSNDDRYSSIFIIAIYYNEPSGWYDGIYWIDNRLLSFAKRRANRRNINLLIVWYYISEKTAVRMWRVSIVNIFL